MPTALASLDQMEGWPEKVLTMQRNWIGRSAGARVVFGVVRPAARRHPATSLKSLQPDRHHLGANFVVLAPEHPLVERFATEPAVGAPPRPRLFARRTGRRG
jgi:leucyl-tRNA synthetase